MRARVARAVLALCLALLPQAPLLAQVRPVLLPSLAAIPGAAPASIAAPALFMTAPAPLPAPIVAPAIFAPAPLPLAFAAAPAAVPSAAPRAVVSLSALNAAPAAKDGPALSGFQVGRGVFDGENPRQSSALSVGAAVADPVPTQAPAKAPRGDTLPFYGNKLPTRMFSDQTQISFHLIRAIDATKKTLDIGIYELALGSVRDALVRAKNRGVRVRIVMDQGHVYPEQKPGRHGSQGPVDADFFRKHRTPEVQSLIDAGFELRTLRGGGAHGIMHNKFAVFDGALVEAGSFNWSAAADLQHFENAVFDDAAARIASYQRDWDWMWSIAAPVDDAHPPAAVDLGSLAPLAPAPQDSDLPVEFNGTRLPSQAFTPHGAAARIAAAIDAAKESLLIANFSFSNDDLIAALKRAKARGLAIRIVFDRDQYSHLDQMAEMTALGFDVRLSNGKDGQNGVMHNKFCVFDGKLVELGSFNWTFNGENNNYENAAFLDAPDDTAAFGAYFERIWKQARVPTPDDHHNRLDAGGGLVRAEDVHVF